jgi:hypothetical protein
MYTVGDFKEDENVFFVMCCDAVNSGKWIPEFVRNLLRFSSTF